MRFLLSAITIIFLLTVFPVDKLLQKTNESKERNCWPVSPSQSTGSIRCWSGGSLVYQNSIYHNGGVLCSVLGEEIKITGGKSLCVIESNQADVWEPPASRNDSR